MNGAVIFKALLKEKIDFSGFDWLENRGLSEFELLISVVLTQNTNWNNVLKALINLQEAKISSLEQIANLKEEKLALLIKPSGFYNMKAKRVKNLVLAILRDFSDIENFKDRVSREWLLNIKGLGFESVDSILNYLCKREILVVDSYTNRLANALGYEFESYDELREFFESGIEINMNCLNTILNKNYELYELYQFFHALIIAFCKMHFKGKNIDEKGLKIIENIRKENL
ncbi:MULTISPECIES: 3-methyladenine DNA glycosylase [unclassified Campylobacter]|uniref:3-methyladenine DNA glycosylase n=1 Tax=unclassified Campylobacter TaxID=2593542 RepID=UPI001237E1F3|nr:MULTISPECIES: 3-methyladenine DNA glycosylase [unclassified Campylobacter]KAA6225618.1 endonuclease III domain-containing protein [Campylobacter sp. LR185c]KAA6227530.1 endonuclease III domain-containing protein [Campylobacter sp. LR196d]KAA6228557.1 endonuclease III domain-containing protein [Campylobacter sp. LR286c]KAA6230947.1 endonuclease III domain-containing protein [Campylobacter sp. LR291e]KAA6233581.1 endonuclease III domain-containing protein [Campylobacter sp. LR264d]